MARAEARKSGLKVWYGGLRRVGQDQSGRAGLRATEEIDAQTVFQSPDELADRRGGHVQFLRGEREALVTSGRFDGAQRI